MGNENSSCTEKSQEDQDINFEFMIIIEECNFELLKKNRIVLKTNTYTHLMEYWCSIVVDLKEKSILTPVEIMFLNEATFVLSQQLSRLEAKKNSLLLTMSAQGRKH